MTNLCGCTRPMPDAWNLCKHCRNDLEQHLAEMHWLDDQLTISLTHDHGIDYRSLGGSKSSTIALPWDERVSRVRVALKAEMVGWVRILSETRTGVRTDTDTDHDPKASQKGISGPHRDTLPSIAAWLMNHISDICRHEAAWNICQGIILKSQDARTIVYAKPADREWLGSCEGRIIDEGDGRLSIWEDHCEGNIWNEPPHIEAFCDKCHREYDSPSKRAEILDKMVDELMTASDIADAVITIGRDLPKANREKVRASIDNWEKRGRISSHATKCGLKSCRRKRDRAGEPCNDPEHAKPAFRFGDVRDLLVAAYGETA